ncbi:MAG TPA: metal-dependent transcriptional regulator [Acidimicrobiia bacterium]|jgi:DtxR family Mn-dependent transcriptional regulator|nr:metal-dependent transcriptional regulator [Acidimicrobiia bacterium]
MAELHDTTEEYLETILSIEEEGIVPMRARLVERLGLSAAAVSETVARLEEQGYVELANDRRLNLTAKGRGLATTVVRRHRLAERLLVDIIGLEWEKVHAEAARWEHAISSDVEEKLVQLLGDPATCPHGNPIPGSHNKVETAGVTALANAEPGPVVVTRVSERLEMSDDAIRLIADAQLMPGCDATVVARDASGVTVKTATGEHVVPMRVAESLYVSAR